MRQPEDEPATTVTRSFASKPALWIVAASLLAIAPLMLRGNSCGHDFNFHLLSWMEVARAWQTGVWYPHWTQDANYGAGEPRFLFYPPASWLLGGLLGSAAPWTAAPALFAFLVLLGSGFSMYRLSREWLPQETATIAACLYLANPYALFTLYERSAFGEAFSEAWIPLILLFALRRRPSIVPLGLAMAAIWLTDAPAAVLASYMLALLTLARSLVERKAWPALRAAASTGLGLGLAAFYIVPAAFERRWVEIGRALAPGMRVEDSFLFTQTADSFHNQVLWTASWIFLFEMAAAAVAAAFALKNERASRTAMAIACLLPPILFLQFPVSAPIWDHAPELRFLQFPWRWLLFLAAAGSLLIGLALRPNGRNHPGRGEPRSILRFWRPLTASAAVLAMIVTASLLFFQPCDDEDAVSAEVAAFHLGQGVEGTDEYTRAGVGNWKIQQGLPPLRILRGPAEEIAKGTSTNPPWTPGGPQNLPADLRVARPSAEHWTFQIEAAERGYAVLRLMDYPAWRVTLNDMDVEQRPAREDGLMVIPIAAGSSRIDVRWSNPPDILLGRAISAVFLLVLLPLGYFEDRRLCGGRFKPSGGQV